MSRFTRTTLVVSAALALGAGVLTFAPAAHSKDADALTMDLLTAGDSTFGANDYYWCADGSKPSSKVPPPSGSCNFPRSAGPMQLLSGQSVSATVSTTSQGSASFSVTGNCSIGTTSYDFTSSPAPTTTAQITNGGTFYLTVLGQGATCVLTGTTPGSSANTASRSTFTVTSPINYDSITLDLSSLKGEPVKDGTSYWCNDTDAGNYDPSSSTNACNFATKSNPLELPYQQSISAVVFTAANAAETISFAVTGDCSVGSGPFDANSTPTTTAQISAGKDVYLTALSGTGKCVMTGTTPGTASLSPGSYTYTVELVPATQQPSSALPTRKRMRVGQRLQLQGADGISTDAGQSVSWRVLRSSRDNCRLIKRSNGAVTLRATSRGTCQVRASAPAVAGKYSRFSENLTIRVR